MLEKSGYPVYAPSCIPAAGGKFRVLEGVPVSDQFTVSLGVDWTAAGLTKSRATQRI